MLGAVIHICWCYLFIIKLGMGINGVGIASIFTNIIMFCSNALFIKWIPEVATLNKQEQNM